MPLPSTSSVTPKGMTPSPPGEGFSLFRSSLRRFLPLKYRQLAGEACLAPTHNNQLPSAPHPAPGGRWPPFMGGRMRGGRDLWFAPTKAFSLGRRCHAFWRDGCGAYRLSGQSDKTHRVPSTPVTACAVPPSVSRRGLNSEVPTSVEALPPS